LAVIEAEELGTFQLEGSDASSPLFVDLGRDEVRCLSQKPGDKRKWDGWVEYSIQRAKK
jgi:hypothetical protein